MSLSLLDKLNAAACALHVAVGAGCAAWAASELDSSSNGVDTSTYIITTNTDTPCAGKTIQQGTQSICLSTDEIVGSNVWMVMGLILTFVFITALFHLALVMARKRYNVLVDDKNNYVRWIEYAVTATLMVVVINIITGNKDFITILLSALVNVCVMACGYVVDHCMKNNDRSTAAIVTGLGWALMAIEFVPIIVAFAYTARLPDVPPFVPWVFGLMLALYSCFGVVQALYVAGRVEYRTAEISYISLSFTTKALLALLVTGGVVSRS